MSKRKPSGPRQSILVRMDPEWFARLERASGHPWPRELRGYLRGALFGYWQEIIDKVHQPYAKQEDGRRRTKKRLKLFQQCLSCADEGYQHWVATELGFPDQSQLMVALKRLDETEPPMIGAPGKIVIDRSAPNPLCELIFRIAQLHMAAGGTAGISKTAALADVLRVVHEMLPEEDRPESPEAFVKAAERARPTWQRLLGVR